MAFSFAATDPAGTYKVLTEFPSEPVPSGFVYRINTGAPLPLGTDAVVMVEDTLVAAKEEGANEEIEVQILAQVDAGENVRDAGSDVRKGDQVLDTGDVISSVGGELGTLAFIGRRSVSCSPLNRAGGLELNLIPRSRLSFIVVLSSQFFRPATSSSPSPTRQTNPRRLSPKFPTQIVLPSSQSLSTIISMSLILVL